MDVDVDRLSADGSRLGLGGEPFHIVSGAGISGYLVEVAGVDYRIAGAESGLVRPAAPAAVFADDDTACDGITD